MNKEQTDSNYYSEVAARATTLQEKIEEQTAVFHFTMPTTVYWSSA